MADLDDQIPMFEEQTGPLTQETTRRALDELFKLSSRYKAGKEYFELLQFISRFRSYSIFNALLVHVQMPGAKYVAPASRWIRDYRRHISLGARPLVILQPMGPVMFVFDVSDTEPEVNASPLPSDITDPFTISHGSIRNEVDQTIENALRDGIKVAYQNAGSLKAGSIQTIEPGQTIQFPLRRKQKIEWLSIPLRYGLLLNGKHNKATQYATLTHELAHLYCGHLGSPSEKWWPERTHLDRATEELEAESVSYLVCQRLGIDNPSEKYLSNYVKENKDTHEISLDNVIKAATLVEQMGKGKLPPRLVDK